MVEVITSLGRTVLTGEEKPVTSGMHVEPRLDELLKSSDGTKLTNLCVKEI